MDSFQAPKSAFVNQSLFMQIVFLLFLALLGSFTASLFVRILEQIMNLNYATTIENLEKNTPLREKNFLKISLCISHFFTFILPSLVFLWTIYKKNWLQAVKLNNRPKTIIGFTGSLLLVVVFPLVQFIYTINKSFSLPQWAIDQETLINKTLEQLLFVNAPAELFFNLFTIALLPAIGEELLFRGILQQTIEKGTKNAHVAVCLTALIFSFIHFQFQGFLPRVFLGGILGYLFVWTRNLWIPIIAHFVYNAGQILLQYAHQQGVLGFDLNEIETVPFWLTILSIFGTSILVTYCIKNVNKFSFPFLPVIVSCLLNKLE